MKPIIGLDLSCLESGLETGVERYARRLAEHLPAVAPDLGIIVLVRPGRTAPSVPEPGRIVNVPSPMPRAVWREIAMPRAVRQLGIALLHAPVAAIPLMAPVPRVATIHDVPERGHPEHRGRLGRNRLRLLHAVRAAVALIVPSFATRDALLRVEPRVGARIRVIPHGVDPDFRPQGLALDRERYAIPPGRFLLWVGTIRPRKDPLVLVEAFARLLRNPDYHDLRLVMSGDLRMDEARLRAPLAADGHQDRLILPGYVPRQDLPDLYRAATLVVVPSRLEGFGLPALEAMATGIPLVISEDHALRELTGDAAITFKTGSAESLTDALDRILTSVELREKLSWIAVHRSKRFTWEGTAAAHAAVYREVLGLAPREEDPGLKTAEAAAGGRAPEAAAGPV